MKACQVASPRGGRVCCEWPTHHRVSDRELPKSIAQSAAVDSECNMRPRELRELWGDVGSHGFTLPTVQFYGHTKGHHRSFSNFFEHAPFVFTVPEGCGGAAIVASGRSATVPCSFSEKAIMLCKAAVMGDYASYDRIAVSFTPKDAKALGRCVEPWDESIWQSVVCDVALAAVGQKFAALPQHANTLLNTGDRIIAEMTRNDCNWGTGLDVGHADASRPGAWRGTNILGWALMVTREQLKKDGGLIPVTAKAQAGAAAAAAAAASTSDDGTPKDEKQEAPSERRCSGKRHRGERKGRLQSAWLAGGE